MGAGTEKYAASAGLDREPAGRPGGQVARAGRGRHQGGPLRRRDRRRRGPAAEGRPDRGRHRRGRAPGHHRRVARRPAARVRQGRQHHRGQRLADLRRRRPPSSSPRRRRPSALGVAPLGEIVGYGQVAGPDPSLLTQPSRAINAALESAGQVGRRHRPVRAQRGLRRRRPGVDGRTSASPTTSSTSTAAPSPSVTPSACPGTRVALTLLHELKRRGGGLGAAALCGGGGQGDAILLSV